MANKFANAKAKVTAKPVVTDQDVTDFVSAFAEYHADDGFSLAHVPANDVKAFLAENAGMSAADMLDKAAEVFDMPEPETDDENDDDDAADTVAPSKSVSAVNNPRHLKAVALAKALPDDFLREITAQGDREIAGKRSVAIACRMLIKGMPEETWADLPRPGTYHTDPKTKKPTGINNADYMPASVKTKSGGYTTKQVSFWNDVAESTAQGATLLHEIAKVEEYKDEIVKRKAMSPLNIRLGSLRRMVRSAAKLKFQMDDLNALPGFTVSFEMEQNANGDAVFTSSTANIRVKYIDPKNSEIDMREILTTGEFLKLDIPAIVANGGHWTAYENARKRSQPDNAESKDGKFAIPSNVADFANAIISLHGYVDEVKLNSPDWTALVRSLKRDGQEETLSSLLEVRDWLNALLKIPAIKDRAETATAKIEAKG